jgi:hypothetical protein
MWKKLGVVPYNFYGTGDIEFVLSVLQKSNDSGLQHFKVTKSTFCEHSPMFKKNIFNIFIRNIV